VAVYLHCRCTVHACSTQDNLVQLGPLISLWLILLLKAYVHVCMYLEPSKNTHTAGWFSRMVLSMRPSALYASMISCALATA
jgi:hypothetical protein